MPTSPEIVKLSAILAGKLVHCEFERETILYFEDGGRLTVEFTHHEYSEFTQWDDIEVWYIDPDGETHAVEVDTPNPITHRQQSCIVKQAELERKAKAATRQWFH